MKYIWRLRQDDKYILRHSIFLIIFSFFKFTFITSKFYSKFLHFPIGWANSRNFNNLRRTTYHILVHSGWGSPFRHKTKQYFCFYEIAQINFLFFFKVYGMPSSNQDSPPVFVCVNRRKKGCFLSWVSYVSEWYISLTWLNSKPCLKAQISSVYAVFWISAPVIFQDFYNKKRLRVLTKGRFSITSK